MEQNERAESARRGKRFAWRRDAVSVIGAMGFLAAAAYATLVSAPGCFRVDPVLVAVQSSGTLETQPAPLLFGRGTATAYAGQRLGAQLERPTEIRSVEYLAGT